MVVVFPAPFGPSSPKISPRLDLKADPIHGDKIAIGFAKIPYLNNLVHH